MRDKLFFSLNSHEKWMHPSLLWLLYLVGYLLPLGMRPLAIPDETRYAQIPRELLHHGHWLMPRFMGLRYFEKPVLGYWTNAVSQFLFGYNEFAVRLPNALATGATSFLIYKLTKKIWGDTQRAVVATFVYLTFFLVFAMGTFNNLDALLAFWITLSLFSFYEASCTVDKEKKLLWLALMGVACGLGFLTKGFVALMVPAISIVPWVWQQKQLGRLLRESWVVILAAVLVVAPWGWLVAGQEPKFWPFFIFHEHLKRFLSQHAQHSQPFWFYGACLLFLVQPWLGFMPMSLWQMYKGRKQKSAISYLFFWLFMPFLFFSVCKGKIITYILPCFAPLSILTGVGIIELYANNKLEYFARGYLKFTFLFVVLLIAVLLSLTLNHSMQVWFFKLSSSYWKPLDFRISLGLLLFAFCYLFFLFRYIKKFTVSFVLFQGIISICSFVIFPLLIMPVYFYATAPEAFIVEQQKNLLKATTIVTNSVGLASALAWKLGRNNIYLLSAGGELNYGQKYYDAPQRIIKKAQLVKKITQSQKRGCLAVVFYKDDMLLSLPISSLHRQGLFSYFYGNNCLV